jgi:hypothetical protein
MAVSDKARIVQIDLSFCLDSIDFLIGFVYL